jgi:hypothetical protein
MSIAIDPQTVQQEPDVPPISANDYTALTGESLGSTLDINTWDGGVKALQAFERLEREIEAAERVSDDIRRAIRSKIFGLISSSQGPRDAGVWKVSKEDVRQAQRDVLFNGLVEACDANSHVFHSLPVQIIQIAVATVTYHGAEQTWANRIFRRDIPFRGGASLIDETIELLKRRSGTEGAGGRKQLTDRLRRGIMAHMERAVLVEKATAPWRMGHGNPIAFEIISGSGLADLIAIGVPMLQRLVLDHKKFIFVPSDTTKEHYLTIGDALDPLEYAVIDDVHADLQRVLGGGYRGEGYRDVQSRLLTPFCEEAGRAVVMGVYRASSMAPARMFYAHRDFVHEAARIALADSILQEHRGFPMLIDMADGICTTYFGAETLNRPTQSALSLVGQPYRYLDEHTTRT